MKEEDVYISSVRLIDTCVYSILSVSDSKIKDPIIGEFHVQNPDKACMYASDLVNIHNKENLDLRFHYDTIQAVDYISQTRPDFKIIVSTSSDKEFFEINNKLMKDYTEMHYPHISSIYDVMLSNRLNKIR